MRVLNDVIVKMNGGYSMAQVGIVMGSDSDMPIMSKAADILEELGISYEMTIISAHREPDVFFEYAKGAEAKGFKVIIAGAGMAAHLPGMCAAIFPMPVIGIPMHTTSLGGRDSLYSIVQMPSGIPVATVAINGGANAGLLAAKILATSDAALLDRLKAYSQSLKESVQKKDAHLQEVGYKNYNNKEENKNGLQESRSRHRSRLQISGADEKACTGYYETGSAWRHRRICRCV